MSSVVSQPAARAAGARRFDTRTVATLAFGHFVHDCYPAFIGTVLPLLISRLGISLAEAGLLASSFRWSAICQPFLGYWADKTDLRYWVILAPTTTAMFMSAVGLAPSYLSVMVLLVLTGFSHAAFHPPSAAMVTRASGTQWGKGASYFVTAGDLGRAVGPLYIASVIQLVGLDSSWVALAPGVGASLWLYYRIGRSDRIDLRSAPPSLRAALMARWRPLLVLAGVVSLRSFATVAVNTFYPTLITSRYGLDWLLLAGLAVSVYELAGAAGSLLGGNLSDRLGRRTIMAVSTVVAAPLILLALWNPPGPGQVALLGLAGLALFASGPVQLVMAHELLPKNRSAATGLFLFIGMEGAIVAAVALGLLADALGLQEAMLASILVSLVSVPLVLLMPETSPRRE